MTFQDQLGKYPGMPRQFDPFYDKADIEPMLRVKTFHSFRDKVASRLKNRCVQETVTAELVGHKVTIDKYVELVLESPK